MKLLGFIFSDYPNVSAQIDNLISRANKRVFVLRYYAAFMPGKDLVKLYCSLVSSILEYSSVTYHSMLTRSQVNRLENVQKWCLKCIFGYGHTYPELLGESGLQTLKARRETAVIKFAQKTEKNPIYEHWFCRNEIRSNTRNPKTYTEKFAQSNRLYMSPMFHMRRLLNNTPCEPEEQLEIMDLSYLFNEP